MSAPEPRTYASLSERMFHEAVQERKARAKAASASRANSRPNRRAPATSTVPNPSAKENASFIATLSSSLPVVDGSHQLAPANQTGSKQHAGRVPAWLADFRNRRKMLIVWGLLHLFDSMNDLLFIVNSLRDGALGAAISSLVIIIIARTATTLVLAGPPSSWLTPGSRLQVLLCFFDVYPVVEVGRLLRTPDSPAAAFSSLRPCFMHPTVIFIEAILESLPQTVIQTVLVLQSLAVPAGVQPDSGIVAATAATSAATTVASTTSTSSLWTMSNISVSLSLLQSVFLVAMTLTDSEVSDTKQRQVIDVELARGGVFSLRVLPLFAFRILEMFGRVLLLSLLVCVLASLSAVIAVPRISKAAVTSAGEDTSPTTWLLLQPSPYAWACLSILIVVAVNVAMALWLSRKRRRILSATGSSNLQPVITAMSQPAGESEDRISIRAWMALVYVFMYWDKRVVVRADSRHARVVTAVSPVHYYLFRLVETLFIISVMWALLPYSGVTVTERRQVTESDVAALTMGSRVATNALSVFTRHTADGTVHQLSLSVGNLPAILLSSLRSLGAALLSVATAAPIQTLSQVPLLTFAFRAALGASILTSLVAMFAARSFGWVSPLTSTASAHADVDVDRFSAHRSGLRNTRQRRAVDLSSEEGRREYVEAVAAADNGGPLATPLRTYLRTVVGEIRQRPRRGAGSQPQRERDKQYLRFPSNVTPRNNGISTSSSTPLSTTESSFAVLPTNDKSTEDLGATDSPMFGSLGLGLHLCDLATSELQSSTGLGTNELTAIRQEQAQYQSPQKRRRSLRVSLGGAGAGAPGGGGGGSDDEDDMLSAISTPFTRANSRTRSRRVSSQGSGRRNPTSRSPGIGIRQSALERSDSNGSSIVLSHVDVASPGDGLRFRLRRRQAIPK